MAFGKDNWSLNDLRREQERRDFERLKYEQAKLQAQADSMRYQQQMPNAFPLSISGMLGGGLGCYPDIALPSLPKGVDAKALEALKSAESRKITARVPDLVHPITAWRAWKLKDTPEGTRLSALGMEGIWEPKKQMEAKCSKHPSPGKSCECGLWSFHTLEKLVAATTDYTQIKVLGKVALWGRIIECENGFRAQYGYPTELWLFDNELEQLGYIYGVPVRTA